MSWLLRRSQEVSLTRMAAALVRSLHLAAALRARVHTAISLHALLGAPLNRSALRLLSHNLCLLKVATHSYNTHLAHSTLLWTLKRGRIYFLWLSSAPVAELQGLQGAFDRHSTSIAEMLPQLVTHIKSAAQAAPQSHNMHHCLAHGTWQIPCT